MRNLRLSRSRPDDGKSVGIFMSSGTQGCWESEIQPIPCDRIAIIYYLFNSISIIFFYFSFIFIFYLLFIFRFSLFSLFLRAQYTL